LKKPKSFFDIDEKKYTLMTSRKYLENYERGFLLFLFSDTGDIQMNEKKTWP